MRTVLAVALTALLCTATGATAASLITGRQVKDGTLTGKDIKNGSIASKDLAPSARGSMGPAGSPGAQGPAGPMGPRGDKGVPGPAAPAPEARQAFITADTTRLETAAVCPVGETVIGGGYRVTTSNGNVPADSTDLTLLYDEPGEQYDGRGSWNVLLLNHSGQTLMLVVTALCQ